MKLSKAQQKVVDLMKEGWELGKSQSMSGRAWLQKDGVGRGGPVEKVNTNTFWSLYKKEIIKLKKQSFPTSIYELKE